MAIDYFDGWSKERAIKLLDSWSGAKKKPALKGARKGDHLKYSASYEIFGTVPRHVAVLLRGAKRGVELSVNGLSTEGIAYPEAEFADIEILSRKPAGHVGKNGNPGIGTGINRNASLQPKSNEVLTLWVRDERSFTRLLDWYAGRSQPEPTISNSERSTEDVESTDGGEGDAEGGAAVSSPVAKNGMSLEQLLRRLDENAATGALGELIALKAEHQRLGEAGCPNPDEHVKHVAPLNVAAGYDIESHWNGEARFIEVKSSRGDREDFFMSDGERETLKDLATKAWLYRVVVDNNEAGRVVEMIPDPISMLEAEGAFEPVAWRVRRKKDG